MKESQHQPQRWQRSVQKLAASRPAAWFLSCVLHHLDRPVLRLSNGRYSLTNLLAGVPVVILTTTGARSGKPRTVPLIGIRDGQNVVLIASQYGRSRHPAWYYNLRANPETELTVDGRSDVYVAREAEGAERDAYWRMAVALYPGYAAYQQRTQGREIPIMVLTPMGY